MCHSFACICNGYLPCLFAAAICRGNLPWLFAVGLFKPFFCVNKLFFFANESFLIEIKPFLYVSKSFFIYENFPINSVSYCYCRGSYGPP